MASLSSRQSRCPFTQPQELKNYGSSSEVTDVLYSKSVKPGVCSKSVCNGSIMNLKKAPLEVRPQKEILSQARDFIDQYYRENKGSETEEHSARLEEVTNSINKTGTYDLTYDELQYGAKLGWRNAPRCIGRISWNNLHLFDCRNVHTAREMFEHILIQIEYGTNGGNIRSSITIFPPREEGRIDFRIWNPMLISFAGYEQPDGSIVGDPAAAELTKLCEKLGWKGPGGPFDILPLVISTPTEEPQYFVIPEEYIMMVPLTHPKYDWFKDLNLEWFALPGVAGLMLDCGGIQFTAAPFNGWYTSPEIGTRDLCDPQRYNMLEFFGEKLGLDTRSNTTLWKDVATLEVNIAVLHSYKEMGVTIVDHHTAAETFMQFYSNEYQQRGGCPADWVWLVPPISGALTPVFHQEMSLYYLKPSYEHQIPGHIALERQKKMLSGENISNGYKPIIKFKIAVLAVIFDSTLYAAALARRKRIAILYASETGRAQSYANNLFNTFSHNFNPQVYNIKDYDVSNLCRETLVAIIASTTGDGEPPQTGKEFTKTLYDLREEANLNESKVKRVEFWEDYNEFKNSCFQSGPEPNTPDRISRMKSQKDNKRNIFKEMVKGNSDDNETPGDHSEGRDRDADYPNTIEVSYAVFALGSTNYKYFCAFGKYLDNLMSSVGANRITNVALGDEAEHQQETFSDWAAQFLKACCEKFGVEHYSSDIPTWKQIVSGKQIKMVKQENEQQMAEALSRLHGKSVETATVVESKTLYQEGNKWYQKITLKLADDSTLQYQPGDHVGIFPENDKEIVDRIISRLSNCPDPDQPIQIMLRKMTDHAAWVKHPSVPVASVRDILGRFLDITKPPSQQGLSLMAQLATDNDEASRLHILSQNIDEYRQWRKDNHPNLLELLNESPSVTVDAGLLLSRLSLLQHRLYSISSSPEENKGQLTLTVASFHYKTQGAKCTLHSGVCSSYLKQIQPGNKVQLFHKSAPDFHLPEGDVPVILVGTGSGIAPLRGFWQHQHHQMAKSPEYVKRRMILYYGCQNTDSNLYAAEKKVMQESKALSSQHLALSRQPNETKTYVQDLLLAHGSEIYHQLVVEKGHLYVCGSEAVESGVSKNLLNIIQKYGKIDQDQGQKIIRKMMDEKRLHRDVFGKGSPI